MLPPCASEFSPTGEECFSNFAFHHHTLLGNGFVSRSENSPWFLAVPSTIPASRTRSGSREDYLRALPRMHYLRTLDGVITKQQLNFQCQWRIFLAKTFYYCGGCLWPAPALESWSHKLRQTIRNQKTLTSNGHVITDHLFLWNSEELRIVSFSKGRLNRDRRNSAQGKV